MKIKILSVLIILVMIISIICGCQAPVTTGTIVDKQHRNAYTSSHMEAIDQYNVRMVEDYHPEAWYIIIEGYDENNEYHQTTYHVSKEEYNSINIGDMYQANSIYAQMFDS